MAKETEKPTPTPDPKHYAHQRILHGDKVIFPGEELPSDLPAEAVAQLVKRKAAGLTPTPPAESKPTA